VEGVVDRRTSRWGSRCGLLACLCVASVVRRTGGDVTPMPSHVPAPTRPAQGNAASKAQNCAPWMGLGA